MSGFKKNIEKLTLNNNNYRKVLFTTKQQQLVLMSIKGHEEIGLEIHPKTTQFIRVESGRGKAIIGKEVYRLKDGDAIIIPSGVKHNIIASKDGLKLYTIYSPPHHPIGTIEKNKEDS
jgi:mannose-6-phosphate isomerase-like protein (cupin superfamily)